ncbi:MAG: hypothetical protein LBJ20_00920 [Candidatus Methanoplasma sp.]|nr:hypothetical protein [Candidatus Methanoplasma sp.]
MSPSTNPKFDKITIYIIGKDAKLEVGSVDEKSPANPTLTVPSKTKVVISSGGAYNVANGKAIYDVKPVAADEPKADILIEGGKFVYTDLATALDDSVSGDVLELRRDADLNRSAAVKDGVELKDNAKNITILTVR